MENNFVSALFASSLGSGVAATMVLQSLAIAAPVLPGTVSGNLIDIVFWTVVISAMIILGVLYTGMKLKTQTRSDSARAKRSARRNR